MASPAMCTCSLPRKAALRSRAAVVAMMTAHVACGGVSQAFFAILDPKRQGWGDWGRVRCQVTSGLKFVFKSSAAFFSLPAPAPSPSQPVAVSLNLAPYLL
jgi:hypothetical protein